GFEVLPGTTRLLREGMGVRPQPLGLAEHEGLELLEEHALVVEEVLHPVRVAEGQMALEEQAVETRERARRGGGMLGAELPHGSLLAVAADGPMQMSTTVARARTQEAGIVNARP